MTVDNRFNLIDEPWIPVIDVGLVSLNQIFNNSNYKALSGNPTQKIALTKLLLAIAQAAYTPIDDDDWRKHGAQDISEKCLEYLQKWHGSFWLYGEKPFLQMPAITNTKQFPFGKLMPSIATGNTTIFNQSQIEFRLDDSEKALLLVHLMGFALGGKQVDNSKPISQGYTGNKNNKGKDASGRPGRSAGHLHSYLVGRNIHETLHKNLLTQENINNLKYFRTGLGTPPWEKMPYGEACERSRDLKNSYMGCLVPLCRFIYIREEKIHNADGILYDRGSKEASREPDPSLTFDPMLTVDRSKKVAKLLLANPEKRPWRELTSLLSFILNSTSQKYCSHLSMCMGRVRSNYSEFSIWSGGMNFSDKVGEQAPRGTNDFVESIVNLKNDWFNDETGNWFEHLKLEIGELEELSEKIYKSTIGFFKCQSLKGKKHAGIAVNLFWQLCERRFQELINACVDPNDKTMRKIFAKYVNKVYDTVCSRDTSRQVDAWAKHRPNLSKYLSNTK